MKYLNLTKKQKLYSEAELYQPQKYLDRFINKYDGFSRIYFNPGFEKSNKLNSRFFYSHKNKVENIPFEIIEAKDIKSPKFDVIYMILNLFSLLLLS